MCLPRVLPDAGVNCSMCPVDVEQSHPSVTEPTCYTRDELRELKPEASEDEINKRYWRMRHRATRHRIKDFIDAYAGLTDKRITELSVARDYKLPEPSDEELDAWIQYWNEWKQESVEQERERMQDVVYCYNLVLANREVLDDILPTP